MSEAFETTNLEETADVARSLVRRLVAGDCVTLEGELGAGKTTLVRAMVEALGGEAGQVSSPTFVLLHTYQTPSLRVHHLDAYRLNGSDDLGSIELDELLEQDDSIVLIEWASRIKEALPGRTRSIRLQHTGETSRRIEIEGW